jgi:hypothetical protein
MPLRGRPPHQVKYQAVKQLDDALFGNEIDAA